MTLGASLLLWAGVALLLLCCVGLAAVRGAYARLHFSAPAGLAALLVAAAVLATQGSSLIADKALLTAVIVILTGPVLSHVTARAAALRHGDDFASDPADGEQP